MTLVVCFFYDSSLRIKAVSGHMRAVYDWLTLIPRETFDPYLIIILLDTLFLKWQLVRQRRVRSRSYNVLQFQKTLSPGGNFRQVEQFFTQKLNSREIKSDKIINNICMRCKIAGWHTRTHVRSRCRMSSYRIHNIYYHVFSWILLIQCACVCTHVIMCKTTLILYTFHSICHN